MNCLDPAEVKVDIYYLPIGWSQRLCHGKNNSRKEISGINFWNQGDVRINLDFERIWVLHWTPKQYWGEMCSNNNALEQKKS